MNQHIDKLIQDYAVNENLNGPRFQKAFGLLVGNSRHSVVVETGSGISTIYLLKEMSPASSLISIDPNPWCKIPIKDPRWTHVEQKSQDCLPDVLDSRGPIDVFLHDSDHSMASMLWELETAYTYVRTGGIIACDDWSWDNHNAWATFRSKHGLTDIFLGSLVLAIKK